ncbi:DUF5988 family protein [Streptomyces sp. NPDC002928]|uniref:DUF5988 family protein n=1 Tax=Streptomyces sp. NPDC002928 TaxID=3154440 RepID=UPI0033A1A585
MSAQHPNAILLGGKPPLLDQKDRIRYVEDVDMKVKVLNGNRYEHFEPTAETVEKEGRKLLVYTWSACTYLAE